MGSAFVYCKSGTNVMVSGECLSQTERAVTEVSEDHPTDILHLPLHQNHPTNVQIAGLYQHQMQEMERGSLHSATEYLRLSLCNLLYNYICLNCPRFPRF